jgi:hypothetical protein
LIGGGVVIVLTAVFLFFKLPKANIEIWPKLAELKFQQTITADKTADSVDLSNNLIPAQYFEEERRGEQEFLATGNALNEGKATGTVTLYNKYDPVSPITLKVGTHLLSDSGKYFVALKKITIPAGKKAAGKVTPGSVEVKVEAAEGGESYNIGPAKFSIPKLAGTPYYYALYAESREPMTGGFAGKVKKVIADDIHSAKTSLTEKLLSEAENSLREKLSSEYVLADKAIFSEILSAKSQTEAGTVTNNFIYSAKVKVKTLSFKKTDLEKFAKDYIVSQIPEEKIMLDKSFSMAYNVKSVDIESAELDLDLEFSAKIYQSIDRNSLLFLLKNKTESQVIESINNKLGENISQVKVNFWPFWVTKSPKNQKAIKIELRFE